MPRQLADELREYEVATVQSLGWSGLRNGELLRRAAAEGFTVFVTADQGIEFQQNFQRLDVGVVVVRAISNRIEDLRPLVSELHSAIRAVVPGVPLQVGS